MRTALKAPSLEPSAIPILPMHFRKTGTDLRLFTTLATLGTPHDITLQELRRILLPDGRGHRGDVAILGRYSAIAPDALMIGTQSASSSRTSLSTAAGGAIRN